MNLTNITEIKKLLAVHDTKIKKAYGQNFLINPAIPQKIASASAADTAKCVLEIGPGIGVLTVELAKLYRKVAAVEKDKSLMPIHEEVFADTDNIEVLYQDILNLDLDKFIKDELNESKINVCANLPYYITTPIVTMLAVSKHINTITVMVQKEVADRFCADIGNENYGSISLFLKYYSTVKKLFDVSPGSFYPAPKVKSTVVSIKLHEHPIYEVKSENLLFRIIRAAFEQRRKTFINAVSSVCNFNKDMLAGAVGDATVRGEELPLSEFIRISNYIKELESKELKIN